MQYSFEEFKNKVIDIAYEQYGKPVCTDVIKGMYESNKSISETVDAVLNDTRYWDYMPEVLK